MSLVTSEVHQDSLFLDAVQNDVFDEDASAESNSPSMHRLLTTFKAETPKGSEPQEFNIAFQNHKAFLTSFDTVSGVAEHCRNSEVDLVGLQVWRGALLLSDFILAQPQHFQNKSLIELAAGTGLTSIVASKFASKVICTDVDRGEILDLIRTNVKLNGCENVCEVREINFFETNWRVNLQSDIETTDVVLVADVVYNQDITTQFFHTLQFILEANPRVEVFLAIEQRCQVDKQGQVISPNFDHFCGLLSDLTTKGCPSTVLTELPCDFTQFFKSYERVKRLHLWHIGRK